MTPDLAALPPPQAYGQSQISITGQPNKPTKEGKRPHKRKMPASAASMQAKHHIGSGSIGSVGKVLSSQVDTLSLDTSPWPAIEASVGYTLFTSAQAIRCPDNSLHGAGPLLVLLCVIAFLLRKQEQIDVASAEDKERTPPAEALHLPFDPQV